MYYLIKNIIFLFSFISIYYFKNEEILLDGLYTKLFILYFLIHLFFLIYFRSFDKRTTLYQNIKSVVLSNLYSIVVISLVSTLTFFGSASRMFILLVFILNGILQLGFHYAIKTFNQSRSDLKNEKFNDGEISGFYVLNFFISILLYLICYNYVFQFDINQIWENQILFYLLLIWLLSCLVTRKFSVFNKNVYYQLSPVIKSYFLMISIISLAVFFSRTKNFDIVNTILFLSIYLVTQLIFDFIYYKKYFSLNDISRQELKNQTDLEVGKFSSKLKKEVLHYLYNISLLKNVKIMSALIKIIKDRDYKIKNILYLDTRNANNLFHRKDKSISIFINDSSVNNYSVINKMLDTIRMKLENGGLFIGKFKPLDQEYDELRNKMPRFMFLFIMPIHFLVFRIFPKIPLFKSFYFLITKGKRKYISKAEVFGRLKYHGFSISNHYVINNNIYFIAELKKTKSKEQNPSYGPLIKLKRVGLDNKVIEIYKFRTMHPYSEFVQEDLVANNRLKNTGKINNDYRLTSWGIIFRKLWIDELPQIYNWLKGDINLVGVRALSLNYFSLYPKKLQEMRIKVKPGLIPPFYADLPSNFEEIIISEERYLLQRFQNKFITDAKYLLKASFNILFKGARSS